MPPEISASQAQKIQSEAERIVAQKNETQALVSTQDNALATTSESPHLLAELYTGSSVEMTQADGVLSIVHRFTPTLGSPTNVTYTLDSNAGVFTILDSRKPNAPTTTLIDNDLTKIDPWMHATNDLILKLQSAWPGCTQNEAAQKTLAQMRDAVIQFQQNNLRKVGVWQIDGYYFAQKTWGCQVISLSQTDHSGSRSVYSFNYQKKLILRHVQVRGMYDGIYTNPSEAYLNDYLNNSPANFLNEMNQMLTGLEHLMNNHTDPVAVSLAADAFNRAEQVRGKEVFGVNLTAPEQGIGLGFTLYSTDLIRVASTTTHKAYTLNPKTAVLSVSSAGGVVNYSQSTNPKLYKKMLMEMKVLTLEAINISITQKRKVDENNLRIILLRINRAINSI